MWYLDSNGNSQWDDRGIDGCFGPFGGLAGDKPITGD